MDDLKHYIYEEITTEWAYTITHNNIVITCIRIRGEELMRVSDVAYALGYLKEWNFTQILDQHTLTNENFNTQQAGMSDYYVIKDRRVNLWPEYHVRFISQKDLIIVLADLRKPEAKQLLTIFALIGVATVEKLRQASMKQMHLPDLLDLSNHPGLKKEREARLFKERMISRQEAYLW